MFELKSATSSFGRFFFFSSRRRHTRFKCDWSSDVCSSDLVCARLHSECRRDELQQALAVARPCELAYPCTVRVARLQLRRDLNRQARLADAAGTRQRHEPMLIE